VLTLNPIFVAFYPRADGAGLPSSPALTLAGRAFNGIDCEVGKIFPICFSSAAQGMKRGGVHSSLG
jgi:hypothetical protein